MIVIIPEGQHVPCTKGVLVTPSFVALCISLYQRGRCPNIKWNRPNHHAQRLTRIMSACGCSPSKPRPRTQGQPLLKPYSTDKPSIVNILERRWVVVVLGNSNSNASLSFLMTGLQDDALHPLFVLFFFSRYVCLLLVRFGQLFSLALSLTHDYPCRCP